MTTTPTPSSQKVTESARDQQPAKLVTKESSSVNHAHVNHFHVNQAVHQEEKAERSRQTIGAAWALTLGKSF